MSAIVTVMMQVADEDAPALIEQLEGIVDAEGAVYVRLDVPEPGSGGVHRAPAHLVAIDTFGVEPA